jgi:pimeloyl-ACP methyl ester carboxylesterase
MPYVDVNGVRLNVQQLDNTGQEQPEHLVMVHGLATNMAFWYFAFGQPLSRRFRVTLFDLRGHGRSEMPERGYTPAEQASDLCGVLDALGIQRAHLMAHSFGGVVALEFACAHPDRVSSLVLADSHFTLGRREQAKDAWAFGNTLRPVLERHAIDLDVSDPYFGPRLLMLCAEWSAQGRELPEELAQCVSPLLGKAGKRTSAEWLKLMTQTQAQHEVTRDDGLTLERLRKLRFPIIAMYGDDSPARLSGSELLEIWPHAVFQRVRDAGHFFPTLRPAEMLRACQRFWDGQYTPASLRPRADDAEGRNWFRSDRIFARDGAWFFAVRGEPRVGPFASREEAKAQLSEHVPRDPVEPPRSLRPVDDNGASPAEPMPS